MKRGEWIDALRATKPYFQMCQTLVDGHPVDPRSIRVLAAENACAESFCLILAKYLIQHELEELDHKVRAEDMASYLMSMQIKPKYPDFHVMDYFLSCAQGVKESLDEIAVADLPFLDRLKRRFHGREKVTILYEWTELTNVVDAGDVIRFDGFCRKL